VLARIALFAAVSAFTLGLGVLALLDGIEMLGQAAALADSGRTTLTVVGALTALAALVPLALWVMAGWAIFVKRQRWEW
jgi:hypothetical protein